MPLRLRRAIALMISLLLLSTSITTAQAAMLTNQQLFAQSELQEQRQQLRDSLARDEIRQQLEQLGVDQTQLDQRIDHLTLSEIQQLNGQMEQLPAGAGVVSLLVLLFIIFIITDALGATDVFPFVHPINR